MVNNPAKLGYWKLVFQGTLVYPPAQQLDGWGNYNGVPTFSKGYIWGVPAAVVQADIDNTLVNAGRSDNPQVRVLPATATSPPVCHLHSYLMYVLSYILIPSPLPDECVIGGFRISPGGATIRV